MERFPLAPEAGSASLAGVDLAMLDQSAVLRLLAQRPAEAAFSYIVTPNADHLVRLRRNPALAPLYDDAGLCLLDSRVVARLAGMVGLTAPPVVTGSDLSAALLADVVAPDDSVAIIGMRAEAVARLAARYGLRNVIHHDPPMGLDRDAAAFAQCVSVVREARARFTFLAVGSPRQERLAHAVLKAGDATGVGLCVGAALEFLTGEQARAPLWMQRAGIEWLHRLAGNPGRLAKRYLVDDIPIVPMLLAEGWRRRRG